MPGFNFRFNDILASIGIKQLETINRKISFNKNLQLIQKNLNNLKIKIIPVNTKRGNTNLCRSFMQQKNSINSIHEKK